VRSLRATPERRAFTALASLLATDSGYTVAVPEAATTPVNSPLARGVVTVVGDAVIDHIYTVDHVPSSGEAIEGHGFERHPGGRDSAGPPPPRASACHTG